ncbi:MAG TPA: hypothetical protein VFA68_05390 [Terriglobales bacterium]|nr:hypothetical protein [Terriglobales bacterium]
MRRVLFLFVAMVTVFATLLPSFAASGPIVMHEVKHDVSLPARDMGNNLPVIRENKFGLLNPNRSIKVAPGSQLAADPVAAVPGPAQVSTTNLLNFDGIGANGFAPPDTNGSVGGTQFVETVNLQYAVYDKNTGAVISAPKSISTLWSGFGGTCQTGSMSDPIVLWDKAAQRWFISIVGISSTFHQCFAISTTSDATGSYNRYDFSFGTNLNDFPKFGVWPDAYYGSYNIFANGGVSFIGAEACAYDRAAMLAGTTATSVCFQKTINDFALLPADLDGNTPPPSGATNPYVELATTTSINLFQFHVDFVNTNNSTFTGPTPLTVAAWTQLCPTGTRACVPQPSPGEKLDGKGDRLNYRNAYRNFTDHEALVLTQVVDKGAGIAGERWYEVRSPRSGATIFQQGTVVNPGATNFWLGSIAQDKLGDIALSYNVSNATTTFPSVQYVGRVPTDPIGKMEAPKSVIRGTGAQTATSNRWGDYASMSIDPADDCTFWASNEYIKTTGSFNWKTRIVKFKFNSCN